MTTHIKESRYFIEAEFLGFYDQMHKRLLSMLHELRVELDCPLFLSNSKVGFARHGGPDDDSQHNVDKWGLCKAVDGYIPDSVTNEEFYDACREIGFTGIGLYKGWSSGKRGFHVDIRTDRDKASPATWAGFYEPRTGVTKYRSIRELMYAG